MSGVSLAHTVRRLLYLDPQICNRLSARRLCRYVPKNWDPYSIYAPTCKQQSAGGKGWVERNTPGLARLREHYGVTTSYDPCIKNYPEPYMNRPDVVAALHASKHYERTWPKHPDNWSYGDERADIALLFPGFFEAAPHWKILVVSGDADAAVPFVGTERWIRCLGRTVVSPWTNWIFEGDVAGSVVQYDGISFVTVKGCGHTIPTYCPELGLAFFANWLETVV